jgi:hypothetical protein
MPNENETKLSQYVWKKWEELRYKAVN